MKTILITGCAGFIGTNLIISLLKEGNKIIGIDNLSTGQKQNLEELLSCEQFIFHNFDVEEPNIFCLKEFYEGYKINEIYHLACPASPPKYQANPVKTMTTNVVGTLNMLKMAKHFRAKFLFTSTSEIYGDPLEHPQTEEYRGNVNSIGPRSCYDEGKRAAESLVYDFHRQFKTDVRVARIFNTYGPRMDPDDGRVVTNFIKAALTDRELEVYGDGLQTRSLCYVDDLVEGLKKLMGGTYHLPVNLGNPEEITVKQLAEEIIDLTRSSSLIVNKELPQDDPTKRKPNIQKANELLGWRPQINRREGLELTVEYFRTLT